MRAILLGPVAALAGCLTMRGGSAPIVEKRNHIFVQAKFNGQGPFTLMVDTGCDGMVVSPEVEHRLRLERWSPVMAEGIGGETLTHLVRLNVVEVGDARLPDVQNISVHEIQGWTNLDGILGSRFLDRFRVTVDYPAHRMIFEDR